MAIRNRYFPGSTVSRYLPPGERSWSGVVYQSGKPVLDSELTLSQDVEREVRSIQNASSGWVSDLVGSTKDPITHFTTGSATNTLNLQKLLARIAGDTVVVEYTGTTTPGTNVIQLSPAPIHGGAPPDVKRTDFVFLEVFYAVVASSPRATATVTVAVNADLVNGDVITIGGVALTAAGAPGVNEFLIGGSAAATAQNIATAINSGANGFTGICTAQTDITLPAQVNLRAADALAGAAGNGITLVLTLANAGSLTASGVLFAGGADTLNKPTQASIYRHGNRLAPSGVNFVDDISDATIGTESTRRVQLQYRIRATGQTEAVNFKTQNGFSNPLVRAQGAMGAPVVGYPFVPADGVSVNANSSALNYGIVDPALWIAGDGSQASATALGTVDGYAYALPICFVFRRNDAYNGGASQGFDPLNNTNGALPLTHGIFVNPIIGSIPVDTSDRPDGRFHDRILREDVLDLRRHMVGIGGLKAELESQMGAFLDGTLRTWALDASDKNGLGSGSGDVGTQFLVCNEVGRSGAKGGVSPSSGDTPRGDSIADFDHVRRRFADWPVVEKLVLPVLPTDTSLGSPGKFVIKASPGYTTWEEGDLLCIDLDSLDGTGIGDWSPTPSGAPVGGGTVSALWPPGTMVTGLLRVIHDDGHYTAAISKDVQIDQVRGIGTTNLEILLGSNNRIASGGLPPGPTYPLVGVNGAPDANSPRRIWVELEITYPRGSGPTDTPDALVVPDPAVYPVGPILEDDPTQQSADFEELLPPQFRPSFRELALEYIANNGTPGGGGPISDSVVSDTPTQIRLPRRVYGNATTLQTVTDSVSTLTRAVNTATSEYGSSSRLLKLQAGQPLSGGGQTLCNVEYFSQDPLPNSGAVGYQVAVYFRTTSPQTLGVQAGVPATYPLPSTLVLTPLVMPRDLWTGLVGAGSVMLGFPYSTPLQNVAVNGSVGPGDYPGEWALSGLTDISVSDFNADTGLLNLHQLVPVDGNQDFTFSSPGVDPEFRVAYRISDPAAYRPTAMAQPLSGVCTHKVFFPFLATPATDSTFCRKGEFLLVVVSRYAVLDADNSVRFTDSNNRACAAVYRTRGLLVVGV